MFVKDSIKAVFGRDSRFLIYGFWVICILLGTVTFVLLSKLVSALILFLASVTAGVFPYLILTAKVQTMRISTSKEASILVVELLDNYKINYYNMQQAIEITAATIQEAPNSKRLLFNLSKGLNRASTKEEIRELLSAFRYAIGTSWAVVLVDNIYFALLAGARVEVALEDLIKTIEAAEELEERIKRENNEATLILRYFVPLCYVFSIIGGIKFFEITFEEFIRYQFHTSLGVGWFTFIVFSYVISMFLRFFLTNNKLDL
ncbi:MAG: hypothetical protein IKU67_04890 [Firmicutes bacterium]|nr:hypothetical protein [Bacillota bacterium]